MNRRVALLGAFSLVVGLLLVASPSQAGGSCAHGPFTDRRTTEISMLDMCFNPTVARVDKGATVTFTNEDGMLHAIGGVTNVFGEMHTELPQGESISYTFKDEGVFPYVCILHPGMAGALVVGDGEGPALTAAIPANPPTQDRAAAAGADTRETSGTRETSDGSAFVWLGAILAIAGVGLAGFGVRRRVAALEH